MTDRKDVRPGDVVLNLNGRDKGRVMLVIKTSDGNYADVCDGRKRRLENPKRKKICHLSFIGTIEIAPETAMTNKKLWTMLRPYRETAAAETI